MPLISCMINNLTEKFVMLLIRGMLYFYYKSLRYFTIHNRSSVGTKLLIKALQRYVKFFIMQLIRGMFCTVLQTFYEVIKNLTYL
jgi:hypothetical protein